jgi:hypothetical protein
MKKILLVGCFLMAGCSCSEQEGMSQTAPVPAPTKTTTVQVVATLPEPEPEPEPEEPPKPSYLVECYAGGNKVVTAYCYENCNQSAATDTHWTDKDGKIFYTTLPCLLTPFIGLFSLFAESIP